MKHSSDFNGDLRKGQIGERVFAELICNPNNIFCYEIKTDFEFKITGNLFFEYFSRGEFSGLMKTKADWWIQAIPPKSKEEILPNDLKFFFAIKLDFLKNILRRQVKDKIAWKKAGGDENTSQGVLVPAHDLLIDILKDLREQNDSKE